MVDWHEDCLQALKAQVAQLEARIAELESTHP